MNDTVTDHFIPTQRFGLAAGVAAFVTFILVSMAEPFGKDVAGGACLVAPLVIGFCSGLIFGTSGKHGLRRTALVGLLGYVLFYLLLVMLTLLEVPISRVFGIFFYLVVIIFPLGLGMSAFGALVGSIIARAVGR